MNKLFVSTVNVCEGALYELMGEDSLIVCFDTVVRAHCDGDVYEHKHIFNGSFVDREGINRPNMAAVNNAHTLADRVSRKGEINTEHWLCVGNVSETPYNEEPGGNVCYNMEP